MQLLKYYLLTYLDLPSFASSFRCLLSLHFQWCRHCSLLNVSASNGEGDYIRSCNFPSFFVSIFHTYRALLNETLICSLWRKYLIWKCRTALFGFKQDLIHEIFKLAWKRKAAGSISPFLLQLNFIAFIFSLRIW